MCSELVLFCNAVLMHVMVHRLDGSMKQCATKKLSVMVWSILCGTLDVQTHYSKTVLL